MTEDYKIQIVRTSDNEVQCSILIIYTGGTIGMIRSESGTLVPFDFSAAVDRLPELGELDLRITMVSFPDLVDSSDMRPRHWKALATILRENYDRYDGFVVLHGTDTMAYTASAISYVFQGLTKPVIFTGAQIPIGQLRSDARENLITAIQIASARNAEGPVIREVAIYFNFALLRGNRSQKVRSSAFAAFESQNYPKLAHSGIFIEYYRRNFLASHKHDMKFAAEFDPNVTLIKIFPGLCKNSFLHTLKIPGLRGIVLETFGSGNTMKDAWFVDALQEAIANDIVILNVSQCSGGEVIQGRYASSQVLEEIGVVSGRDITSEAAVTKLMFLLATEKSTEKVKLKLQTPLAGEMDA